MLGNFQQKPTGGLSFGYCNSGQLLRTMQATMALAQSLPQECQRQLHQGLTYTSWTGPIAIHHQVGGDTPIVVGSQR